MLIVKRTEIECLIDIDRIADAVRAAYCAYSDKKVLQPPVGHITFEKENADCHIKYGHILDDDFFVIKVATGFPNNNVYGLKNGNGLSLVLSAKTGAVQAVLHDEGLLTDVRTAVGGAIATKALSRPDAKKVLVIGTGTQAKLQIEAHHRLLGAELTFNLWGRSKERATQLSQGFSEAISVAPVDDLATACSSADIIITATGATVPLIMTDWIRAGTHITAIGADAPGKQELETTLIERADIVVADSILQCIDHGEIENAVADGSFNSERVVELGALLCERDLGRVSSAQISIADLTGLAAQDIAIANVILDAIGPNESRNRDG